MSDFFTYLHLPLSIGSTLLLIGYILVKDVVPRLRNGNAGAKMELLLRRTMSDEMRPVVEQLQRIVDKLDRLLMSRLS